MYCPNCGKQTVAEGLFCNYCGARLSPPENTASPQEEDKTVQVASPPSTSASQGTQPTQKEQSPPSAPTLEEQKTARGVDATITGNEATLAAPPASPSPSLSGAYPPIPPTQQAPPATPSGAYPAYPLPPSTPSGVYPPTPQPAGTGVSGVYPPTSTALPGQPAYPVYGQTGVQPALPPQAAPGYPQSLMPPQAPPQPRQPVVIVLPERPNWAQRLNIRLFQPFLASNSIFSTVLGALVATLLGMLSFFLLITIVTNTVPESLLKDSGLSQTQEGREVVASDTLDYDALQNPFRNTADLFLRAQNVRISDQLTYTSDSSSGTVNLSFNTSSPFHTLLLLQGLFLILGGYIAASSDFRNTRVGSLLRGAAIAIPYTVLLLLLSTQVNGDLSPIGNGGTAASSYKGTITVDINTLLLFGVLWGALFGLIGAGIKLGQGQMRHHMHRFLYTHRHPQITGIIVGGLSAALLGIFLTLIITLSLFSQTNSYEITRYVPDVAFWLRVDIVPQIGNLIQDLTRAVALLAYACGAPIVSLADKGSYYGVKPGSNQIWQQLGAGLIAHPWVFVLLLVPIIALFLGGRVSTSISRVRGVGPGAIQGALIALPFTALLFIFTAINSNNATMANSVSSYINENTATSIGANFGDVVLWGLVSGAIMGALGGAYQNSALRPAVSKVLGTLVKPVLLIFAPLYIFFDLLLGRPRAQKRSGGYVLLYTALIAAIVLGIISLFVGVMFLNQNQTITRDQSEHIRDIMALLLIALPGILLLSSAAATLARDPLLEMLTARQAQPMPPQQPQPAQPTPSQTVPSTTVEPTIQEGGA